MGPPIRFTVRYNQRDKQFLSNFNYSNFGRQWTFDFLAFIKDQAPISRPSGKLSQIIRSVSSNLSNIAITVDLVEFFLMDSARRYFSTKEFIFKGVPNVFIPKTPLPDNRFFDPSNTWYIYDNRPLKESLEKFAKFPISTSFENNEPRLLLVAVDVQDLTPVVFDSYEKEDGTRKSEYGRYGRLKSVPSAKDQENAEQFEHVIRYNDGIIADFGFPT